ncbi:MAG: helix-turn-helix domain-containing protein [Pirellulaceae bacterium]
MAKKKPQQSQFGQVLRDAREGRYSLRSFAKMVGVSPTYLSQVEQGNVQPPTADRVKRMAEVLGANADEWIALAGRVPEDLPEIIHEEPTEFPELLRDARGLTAAQLQQLREAARKMKEGNQGNG